MNAVDIKNDKEPNTMLTRFSIMFIIVHPRRK